MLNIDKLRSLSIILRMVLCLFFLISCANHSTTTPTLFTPIESPLSQTPPTSTRHPATSPADEDVMTTPTREPGETATLEVSPTPFPNATQIPDSSGITWQIIVEGLEQPTGLSNANDGSGRLFILEKAGVVKVFQDGQLAQEPFIDLRDRVRTQGYTTAGLLGITFHPKFSQNGFLFVNYTGASGATIIARFNAFADLRKGDPASELILLEISQPIGEHRGGDLAFGPDGYLYASIGDGGAAGYGDPDGNAQNTHSLLGKILRLDVDSDQSYATPSDNPFASGGGRPEVWASGLRNPWRFSFDTQTGDLYIADVGENAREEVNFLPGGTPGGSNFGWNTFEGNQPYLASTSQGKVPDPAAFLKPVTEYDHTQGCSITGGVVYRGQALPEWSGVYIYGDYCQGNIWGLLKLIDGNWENKFLVKLPAFISSFGTDEAGEIYLVDISGKIYQMTLK